MSDAFGTHVEDKKTHRLRAGVGAEMRDVHRLHERLALMIGAGAEIAVIDRDLTFEDVSKQRRAVPVEDGPHPRREGCDRCRHVRRAARRIVQRFAHHGLAGRKKRDLADAVVLGAGAVRR